MGPSIASLLVISVLLTAVVIAFRANQIGTYLLAEANRSSAGRISAANNTAIEIIPIATSTIAAPSTGCTSIFRVSNTGSEPLGEIELFDLLVSTNAESSPNSMSRLTYLSTGNISSGAWSMTIPDTIEISGTPTANDSHQKDVLNRGEQAYIEMRLAESFDSGTIIISTHNGFSTESPLQRDGSSQSVIGSPVWAVCAP